MDQSQLNSLDPRLRDAYQRIMGMQVQPKPVVSSQTAPKASFPLQNQPADPLTSDERPKINDIPSPVTASAPAAVPAPTPIPNPTPSIIHTAVPDVPPPVPVQAAAIKPAPEPPAPMSAQHLPEAPAPQSPAVQQAAPQVIQPVVNPVPEQTQPQQLQQVTPFDPVVANNQMHAYVSQEVAGAKQSLKTIQIIYVVGGIVFFAVYVLFWMKFFNVASPF